VGIIWALWALVRQDGSGHGLGLLGAHDYPHGAGKSERPVRSGGRIVICRVWGWYVTGTRAARVPGGDRVSAE
jgi:hypothetical protein